jgi:ligand-binding sensor domain-containing protein
MYRILSRTLVSLIFVCVLCSNSGLANLRQGIVAPKVNKRIAGHRILKTLEIAKTPSINFPRAIFQDSEGLIYIGGSTHFSIFNEKENLWKTYSDNRLTSGLPGSQLSVVESSDKKIWATSRRGGFLVFLNNDNWEDEDRFNVSVVNFIFPSNTGGVWAFTASWLYHYDGKDWADPIKTFKILGDTSIFTGLQDSKGYIWLSSPQGLFRYDVVKKDWSAFLQPQLQSGINQIYEDTTGNLWFANSQGEIVIYDRGTTSWRTFNLSDIIPNSFTISGIVEDSRGQILFATHNGLVSFDTKYKQWYRSTSKNSGLLESWVTCIYKDRSNRIWLGTPKGILVLEP